MVFVWWLARCGVEPHSELRSRRDLKAVIIEESPGVLEYKRGVRFIDIIDKLWEEQMPGWTPLRRGIEDGRMGNVPTQRARVFLVSVPAVFAHFLPLTPPPPETFTANLADFLEEGNPSFTGMMDESIPEGMRAYYQEYTDFSKNAYDAAPCFTIGVADISRGMGKQFKHQKKQDEIPSLTTSACYMSVWGFGKDGHH